MSKRFGIIGGDRRQAELARLLMADGHEVYSYGLSRWDALGDSSLEQTLRAEIVVLPLPLCKGEGMLNSDGEPLPTRDLFRRMHKGQRILAGKIEPEQIEEAAAYGLVVTDYLQREELAVANAAATAEAAIQVAMEHLDRSLLGMDCAVLGFGRIGNLLSHRLCGLGARVTAAARRPESLAWIRAYGFRAVKICELDKALETCGVVFNTIPAEILNESLLTRLPRGCLCVDLASVPGVQSAAAEKLGISVVWAKSLPGRLLPQTAAEAIRDTIYNIITL